LKHLAQNLELGCFICDTTETASTRSDVMQEIWPSSGYQVADCKEGTSTPSGVAGTSERESTRSWSTDSTKQRVVDLYDAQRPHLYRYLIGRGMKPQDTEEIVQECFLRLFQHVMSGGNDQNLRAWLYQVAHNIAENLRKSNRRTLDSDPEFLANFGRTAPDRSAGPEEQLLEREQSSLLKEKLSKLSQLQRDCLNLRVEGFRYREIGEILNVGTSTVAGSLRNAVANLVKDPS
jgi:RNA polymerase sigma-70 factor (ECF subfamily)